MCGIVEAPATTSRELWNSKGPLSSSARWLVGVAPSQPRPQLPGALMSLVLVSSIQGPCAYLLPAGVGPTATSLRLRPHFSGPSETLRKVLVIGERVTEGSCSLASVGSDMAASSTLHTAEGKRGR